MTSSGGARAAFGLLSILGGPGAPVPSGLTWFPVVGLVLGGLCGAAWWGADRLWAPLVAAVLVVGLDLVLTGGLHLDGLADAADGLLAPMDRERRLAVMVDPSVGAFGVGAVVLVLAARVAALASLVPDPLVLAGIWAAARTVMALTVVAGRHARADGGLADGFRGVGPWGPALVGGALAFGPAVGGAGIDGALAVGACVVGSLLVIVGARSRLGGYTGDVLGAAGLVGETAALLLLAAAA